MKKWLLLVWFLVMCLGLVSVVLRVWVFLKLFGRCSMVLVEIVGSGWKLGWFWWFSVI